MASAAARFAARAAADPSLDATALKHILQDAIGILVDAGYHRREARLRLIRRVGRFGKVVPPSLEQERADG